MAYQGYSDQPSQGGGYGGGSNPYNEETSYSNPYARGQYDAQPSQNNYEMGNMNRNNPDRILNKARQINDEVDALDARQAQLEKLQSTYLKDDNPELKKTVDAESTALMTAYQNLVQETKLLKQDRESGNPRNSAQVGRIDRKVKKSLNSFHQLDSKFQNGLMERFKRDYRIVKPDASEAEMREAVKNPEVPVFSQTLLNTDRRGQAQTVASEVHNRHLAIRKIETDMLRLAEMFQDLEAIVVQQEAQVTQIEQRGEEVREDVTKANVELDGAVTKARAARKKKWICLGIAVAIIIIIVVVVVVVVEVVNK